MIKILLTAILLTSCVVGEKSLFEHQNLMNSCRKMCGRGKVRLYDTIDGACFCKIEVK